MTVSILLVDDHPMIRHGLRTLLSGVPDFQVVGEASDGVEALQKIDLTKPDILIIDMMMPNLNGLEVLTELHKLSPATRTIVFSMQSAEPYILKAFEAGAEGYILKDMGPGEIISAIHAVLQGNRYMSEHLSQRIEADRPRLKDPNLDMYQTLTTREREVFQMTAEGRSSTEIGEKIGISARTVEVHRGHFMKKLGLRNQADLIRYAIKRGILSMEE